MSEELAWDMLFVRFNILTAPCIVLAVSAAITFLVQLDANRHQLSYSDLKSMLMDKENAQQRIQLVRYTFQSSIAEVRLVNEDEPRRVSLPTDFVVKEELFRLIDSAGIQSELRFPPDLGGNFLGQVFWRFQPK